MNDDKGLYFLDQLLLRAPLFSTKEYRPEDLNRILQEPSFRNALWLASPVLYRELEKIGFDGNRLDGSKKLSLLSYYNRACFRPTPFGAFASFSVVSWSENRKLQLASRQQALLHLLPDREFEIRNHRTRGNSVIINPLLYPSGKDFRYLYSGNIPGRPDFLLKSIPANPVNRAIRKYVNGRVCAKDELQRLLVEVSLCTTEEADEYLGFLITEQVLLTDSNSDLIFTDEGLQAVLQQVPYQDKLDLVKLDPHRKSAASRSAFYAALERPVSDGGADRASRISLQCGLEALRRLYLPPENTLLQQFMQAFKQRFDRRQVPLLLALDPDQGIPYGELAQTAVASPLLDELPFPGRKKTSPRSNWTPVHQLFLRTWLQNSSRDYHSALKLGDIDLAGLPVADEKWQWPPSLAVFFRPAGDEVILESASGASGTALAGRFSCFSPNIHQLCRHLAQRESEANPGVVFAEISQLSDAHVDNINRRCLIYDYIIPLNAFSEMPAEQLILPEELMLSVRGEELILESKRLRKRVIPRLPTAFNYRHNELGVFRFLCDLQHQYLISAVQLDLERLFPGLSFYPRVQYGKCILSPATWFFSREDMPELLTPPASLGSLHLFRERHHLPARVIAGAADRQLVFDLAQDEEARFFLAYLRNQAKTVIREYLPAGAGNQSEDLPYATQFLALAVNPEAVYQPGLTAFSRDRQPRNFRLGSEWLYLKIYCTPASSNQLLLEGIAPIIAKYREKIALWFFIRYAEDGYHLRLRLRSSPEVLAHLLTELGKKLNRGRLGTLVREYQGATYQREVERYDPHLIGMAESCFEAGSEWVLYATGQMPADFAGLDEEGAIFPLVWLMARHFFDEEAAITLFYAVMAESQLAALKNDRALRIGLDKKYRSLRQTLTSRLGPDFLSRFSRVRATAKLLASIREVAKQTVEWAPEKRRAYLADLVHMQVNRLFRFGQLNYEVVVYYCLHKFSSSVQARKQADR